MGPVLVVVSWQTNHEGLNISPRVVGLVVHGAQGLAAISLEYADCMPRPSLQAHVYCASPVCTGLLLRRSLVRSCFKILLNFVTIIMFVRVFGINPAYCMALLTAPLYSFLYVT